MDDKGLNATLVRSFFSDFRNQFQKTHCYQIRVEIQSLFLLDFILDVFSGWNCLGGSLFIQYSISLEYTHDFCALHDDVFKWKRFPRYWPFVRGIHRWPVNSPHKGQCRGGLIFSLIRAWINDWVNSREASDLRRHRAHYDANVMVLSYLIPAVTPVRL